IFDYLVDEHPNGSRLFGILDPETVAAVFDTSFDIESRLASAVQQLDDQYGQLVLTFVGIFAALGRRLCFETGNQESWKALGSLVSKLLYAETCSALAMNQSAGSENPKMAQLM